MSNIYNDIQVLISFILALAISLYSMPWWIKKLKAQGWLARDMYKKGKKMVVDKGGVAIIFIAVVTFFISVFIFRILNRIISQSEFFGTSGLEAFPTQMDYLMLLVVGLYAMFGILDDYIEIRHIYKMIIPFFLSLPLTTNMDIPIWHTPFGELDLLQSLISIPYLGTFTLEHGARFIVLPIYIMVAANLVNMHSGFNGLQSGLSTIILVCILIKSIIFGRGDNVFTAIFAGALIGFLFFNFYPAQIFEGNIGALTIGSMIGVALVSNRFFVAGCIIFIPHFINWGLYGYWRLRNRLNPNRKGYRICKFGKLRKDDTIYCPNALTLKWVPARYFRLSERKSVLIMYGITIIFGLLFIII